MRETVSINCAVKIPERLNEDYPEKRELVLTISNLASRRSEQINLTIRLRLVKATICRLHDNAYRCARGVPKPNSIFVETRARPRQSRSTCWYNDFGGIQTGLYGKTRRQFPTYGATELVAATTEIHMKDSERDRGRAETKLSRSLTFEIKLR